ncbi:MAG TPA: DUF998 domain-containing protein [Acidimicrobiales bacterium]|nr:DUF998 domain-containing protein [Acidimicrobiales bacterium]
MARAPDRYAGLAAVAILWSSVGAATVLGGFPLLGERPLSWLVAGPWGLLFSVGLAVGAVLLVAFHGHVRRRYRVDGWFSAAMLTGLAGQLVAAVLPIDAGGTVGRVHAAAALVLGASLPVLMWRFAATQPPGRWRRVAVALFRAEAVACVVGVLLSRASVAAVAEILPAVGFHLWIVVLSVAGPGRERHGGPGSLLHAVPVGEAAAGEALVGGDVALAGGGHHLGR